MPAEDEDAGPRILCLVGFGRKTVEGMNKALKWVEEKPYGIQIQLNILTKNDDFVMEEFSEKRKILMLIASFTERNNILGESPDFGELSQVYEKVKNSTKSFEDVFVIYAGIPHSTYEKPKEHLYYLKAEKLIRSQPALEGLMKRKRFLTVTDQYEFQKHQREALKIELNIGQIQGMPATESTPILPPSGKNGEGRGWCCKIAVTVGVICVIAGVVIAGYFIYLEVHTTP